jgi:hypothetical protein
MNAEWISSAVRRPLQGLLAARSGSDERGKYRGAAVVFCVVALGVPACSADRADPGPRELVDAGVPAPVVDAAVPDAEPAFAGDVRSLQLTRSIAVRARPDDGSEIIGTVARDIRVAWRGAAEGKGCASRWIELEPRGWICEQHLAPSTRAPWGVEMPRLDYGEIVPGVYGKVTTEGAQSYVLTEEGVLVPHRTLSGSVMVRRYDEVMLSARISPVPAGAGAAPAAPAGAGVAPAAPAGAGVAPAARAPAQQLTAAGVSGARAVPAGQTASYWLIDRAAREYLPTKSIRQYQPSTFQGTRLGDETGLVLPLGFPLSRGKASERVPVYSAVEGGRVLRKLEARAPVSVFETARDVQGNEIAYRIGEAEWVRASEMRLAAATEPPPLTEPHERWFDIDLDQQVLVAYEGALPVYATLISSGSRQNPTETGVYRIWIKFAETDMSDLSDESPYSVATVPWSQFFSKDLALHTAYWHDTFGTPRSHGCINLAPLDARFLYFWSAPQVPAGWSMAHGNVEYPGSVVRVRSKVDPMPELRGYARRVHEARRAS